ncbi:uncharacterized protein TNCV_1908071 [Trichonephila clavipes]|nr:uncharacterized protein TNCV_1908071 [Trichonephila clavipes]
MHLGVGNENLDSDFRNSSNLVGYYQNEVEWLCDSSPASGFSFPIATKLAAVLRERNAMKSHRELVDALGNNALPYCTVAGRIGNFQHGRVSAIDEQRSERLVSVEINLARAVIEQLMHYIKGL